MSGHLKYTQDHVSNNVAFSWDMEAHVSTTKNVWRGKVVVLIGELSTGAFLNVSEIFDDKW